MPADRLVELPLGSNGLDLRSSVTELEPGDLADTLNWQIDRTGALLKRQGFSAFSVAAPADILKIFALQTSGETIYLLVHCQDGQVYYTLDGSSWTSIDAGLSQTTPIGWVQYLDTVYYCDGANAVRSWDGTTLTVLPSSDQNDVQTVTITGTPTGGTFELSYGGFSTVGLDVTSGVTAAAVSTALEGLTSIGAGNVHCTGGPLPGTGVVVTFVGALAARPITLMTSTNDAFTGGTAPASHVAHTTVGHSLVPEGNLFTVWRNRMYVSGVSATPRRVFWSFLNDPTSFIYKTNYVDFPADSEITAMRAGPNVGLGSAGADGVLVFTKNRVHRIYNDDDNINGVIDGGANLLVDEASGAVGQGVIAPTQEGNLWFLSEVGFFSTDGHAVSPESTRVLPLLRTFGWNLSNQFNAFSLNGRYYLAFTPVGQAANTRVLEAYADLFRIGWIRRRGGQHQWMAHDIPISSAVVVNTGVGEVCYFADSSPGDGAFVRRLFDGGTDADGDSGTVAINARARTGAQLFGVTSAKRLRRAELYGYGNVTMSVGADLESGVGESNSFDMRTAGRKWGQGVWGQGVWGGGGGAKRAAAYYTQRGRYLTFTITENSSDTGTADRVLGYAGADQGGAAVYSVILKITPLDGEN